MFSPDNYLRKPYMKEYVFPCETPSAKSFLQDFNHLDQLHANRSLFGVLTGSNSDSLDVFPYRLSPATHLYECDYKPYTNNNNGLYGRDNFQSGGCLNLPQENLIDMIGPNQSHMSLDLQETKPMNIEVLDGTPCATTKYDYYTKGGLYKNDAILPLTRRTGNTPKKEPINLVKGQWTAEEDRYVKIKEGFFFLLVN